VLRSSIVTLSRATVVFKLRINNHIATIEITMYSSIVFVSRFGIIKRSNCGTVISVTVFSFYSLSAFLLDLFGLVGVFEHAKINGLKKCKEIVNYC
jgi:hypothetical protein